MHAPPIADSPSATLRWFAARLYTGPCFVRPIAQQMRAAGLLVTIEGTEHVHYRIPASVPGDVPRRTAAALRATFPPSREYSWAWVADCVSMVRPDDDAAP